MKKYWPLLNRITGMLILLFIVLYFCVVATGLRSLQVLLIVYLIALIIVVTWLFKNEPKEEKKEVEKEEEQQPKGEVMKEIKIIGFEEDNPIVLRVLDNNTTYLIFEIFPPENDKWTEVQIDNLAEILSQVTSVEVIHDDRELFIIFSNDEKVIQRIIRFFECFESFSFQPITRLSQRANKYMDTLYYYAPEWTCDKDTICRDFNSQNFPLFEPFIDFQLNFSGYTLTLVRDQVKQDGRHAFDLRLFCKMDIEEGKRIDYEKEGDDYWLNCGCHHAPFGFWMNQKGEIAVSDGDDFQVISSSYLKFVEGYAVDNHFFYEYGYYNCVETSLIEEYMSQNEYTIIPECSDQYATFYTNGKVVIKNATFRGSSERYLYLLTNSKKAGVIAVEKMKHLITNKLEYPIKSIQEIMAPIEAGRGY